MKLNSQMTRITLAAASLLTAAFVSIFASAASARAMIVSGTPTTMTATMTQTLSPLMTQVPAGFDTQAWSNWILAVVATGTPTEMPNGIYLTKARIEPADSTKTHQADYFSTVGGFRPDGSFAVDHVEGVSETWTIATDGQRDIDQWLFSVSRDGDLLRTLHMRLVETEEGQVLQDDVVPSTADESMARWIAQLDSWYAVKTGTGSMGGGTLAPEPVLAPAALANDAGATGSHAGLMFQFMY